MDVVLIFNGIGNQMSQYAFYLSKYKANPRTIPVYYTSAANHNGFELDKVFNINKIDNYFLSKLFIFLTRDNLICKIIKKILSIGHIVKIISETMDYDYNPKLLKKGNALLTYFWGGWHSYKYIENVKEEVQNLYKFDYSKIGEKNQKIICEMRRENSISVHIRRGDYLNTINSRWGGVVSIKYYEKAFEKIKEIPNKKYYFFTDDCEWVKNHFELENMIVVDWNKGSNSWIDMLLMSNCKININPNSTFSWWASWLNNEENKKVYVPDRFVVDHKSKDFYPDDWIQIEI